ncbi:fungal-specific transcription factor-like protein [Patellaria atrata CBS 101060]|uniref:Fungal-specific transcription factor-like protein n=1 Tax=Patellaria atrata CBS 101060 TaxID=1346257 RepID=A0A9P4VQV8_9PEZI|nr:fungal-specific transcription factor-like protein [Patellaria atrata CBS 101060]
METLNSQSPINDPAGTKRKNEDGQPQQRAKRNRYISIACNECKRRKIKCNGQTPCQRCGNLSLECVYAPNCCNSFKDSEEYKAMSEHIAHLQAQVDSLFSNLNQLRTQVESRITPVDPGLYNQLPSFSRSVSNSQMSGTPNSPTQHRSSQSAKHPKYQGPTSSVFNLGVAKSSLQTMGITSGEIDSVDDAIGIDQSPAPSPPPSSNAFRQLHPTKDPIWSIPRDEALRLLRVWQEEMGIMYNVVDIEKMIRHATLLYTFMDAANRSGLMQGSLPGSDGINDAQTSIMKLIISIALILEGRGKSELGRRLFENAHIAVERQLLAPVDDKGIRMLSLSAMYHFHRDDETRAWRVVGIAARLCMELGLHRRETYNTGFTDEAERTSAINLFWSIYVLDRRWSFGTGMPFALQDADIDPLLPRPDETVVPYLSAMVTYSNIGSKVWKAIANVENAPGQQVSKEEIGYLDYQVIQWHRTIPDSLRYTHPNTGQEPDPAPRGIHRLRIVLYLRANQMRILIYRPVLHTATSIMENMAQAQTVVDVAKDTIRVLTHTNTTTDLYRTQQVLFNYFILSAIAVLFLAVSHAPAQFSDDCKNEFYMALDLVRGLSSSSFVSNKLWKTVKVLKEAAQKLGLNYRNQPGQQQQSIHHDPSDPHSSAAVAMAGLAGHQVDEAAIFGNGAGGGTPVPGQYQASPNGMANELTSMFEAVGAFSGLLGNQYQVGPSGVGENGEIGAGVLGQDDELARIMGNLF